MIYSIWRSVSGHNERTISLRAKKGNIMKKIIAFVLALIMLAAIAVSTTAASAVPFKADSYDSLVEYLINYYKTLYTLENKDAPTYLDGVGSIAFYQTCSKCGGQMLLVVTKNGSFFSCLNSECENHGYHPVFNDVVIPRTSEEKGLVCPECGKALKFVSYTNDGKYFYANYKCENEHTASYKLTQYRYDETYYPIDPIVYPVNPTKPVVPVEEAKYTCPTCEEELVFDKYEIIGNDYYAIYTCKNGHSSAYLLRSVYPTYPSNPTTPTTPTHGDEDSIAKNYKCTACGKNVEFKYYVLVGDAVYARYECENGHPTVVPASITVPKTDPKSNIFIITVETGEGGKYSFADGRPFGAYGDKKTIKFTTLNNFTLEDVTINGVSYGAKEEITFTLTKNTVISATFKRKGDTAPAGTGAISTNVPGTYPAATTGKFGISATTDGKGYVTVKKNNVSVDPTVVRLDAKDKAVYTFVPKSANYSVKDVKVDGKSVGAVSTYTFKDLKSSHTVEVEFKWNSPFTFIADGYEDAVEYVTESGIMQPTVVTKAGSYFSGTNIVSIKAFACALAEMQDVEGKLNTDDEREIWATEKGLILKTDKATRACDIQTACRIVKTYLTYIEKLHDVSFVNFSQTASDKDNAIAIKLIEKDGYEVNRQITRYDLAAVCYLIKRMPFTTK